MRSSICAHSRGPAAMGRAVRLAGRIITLEEMLFPVTPIHLLALPVPKAAANFFFGKERKDFLVGHLDTIRTKSWSLKTCHPSFWFPLGLSLRGQEGPVAEHHSLGYSLRQPAEQRTRSPLSCSGHHLHVADLLLLPAGESQ